jgi:hypothetical protein
MLAITAITHVGWWIPLLLVIGTPVLSLPSLFLWLLVAFIEGGITVFSQGDWVATVC